VLISDLAKRTGVSLRSLRYYEQKGLISPKRLDNGYREYQDADVDKVRMIQLYLSLGASTEEIAKFISCSKSDRYKCAEKAIQFYEEKLANVRNQLAMLRRAEKHIESLLMDWKKVAKRANKGRGNDEK
jgi:DNA-binding transcriptional MerR regulator